ncbi:MFS transporter [Phaeobacter marinintestinus]|uniref:MFS transporter n=1 Tax=Falsiphaeobacter marinintestinus TaxID=1492905 RepID=UPI0011B58A80|nr:MFS transporter [Phaeobacter marinintestinus]
MKSTGFLVQNAPFLAAGALMTFMSGFGQTYFISIFAGEIRQTFGLSHGEWGGVYMIGTTLSAVVMVWAGGLTDVFRVRALGPVVLIGLASACLAMTFNQWAWALPFVIFLLRFFGQGMSSHIAVVAMTRWFVAKRGRALSIASLGFAVGEAILPVLFVALMAVVDWRYLWVVGALLCLTGVPILSVLLGKERTPQNLAQTQGSTGMNGISWTRAQALRNPLFWAMVPAILGPSAFNTAFFFHQVHLAEVKGMGHLDLVAFFPLYTLMSVMIMVLSGWALDRFGSPRLTPLYQLPMVVAFLIFSVAAGPVAMFFGFFFLAMTTGANSTLPNAFWADFYGTAHIGSIKAMAAAVMVFGSAVGPGLTGLLIDLDFGLEHQFQAIAVYFVFTTLVMSFGIQKAKRSLPLPETRT